VSARHACAGSGGDRRSGALIRQRKLNSILNALMMQIEDWDDSSEVNRLLRDALREVLRHQVGKHRARAALSAIDALEEAEAERWAQVSAGTLPPRRRQPSTSENRKVACSGCTRLYSARGTGEQTVCQSRRTMLYWAAMDGIPPGDRIGVRPHLRPPLAHGARRR
jgi:hypothetical protein